MKRISVAILILLAVTAGLFANGDGEVETAALEGYSRVADEGLSFDLQWQIDGGNLKVQIAAPTTGWVAVGFDAENKMAGANILIGYVADGAAFLRDDFGSAQVKHESDTGLGGSENFSELEGEETDGVTVLRFTIPLDSGDAFDKPLEPGKSYKVIYAYGPAGKDDFGSYHTKTRGSFELTL